MVHINKKRFYAKFFVLIFCISILFDFIPVFAVTINQTYVENMNNLYLNNPKWTLSEYKNEINNTDTNEAEVDKSGCDNVFI